MRTIRNYLVIALMFTMVMCSAQDVRTTLGVFIDPNATRKDGFNIGLNLDYQRTVMYNKVNVFYFPNLRGLDYLELSATLCGFNAHLGYFNTHRFYGGFKAGAIFRETNSTPYPMMGFEAGYEWYITDGFCVGFILSTEYRCDNKIWEAQAEPYWRNNGFFKLAIVL